MAVPTVYNNLIKHRQQSGSSSSSGSEWSEEEVRDRLRQYRLMVSGSAALPETQMDAWEELSGQRLLERFGMTDLLMAISNPYDPTHERRSGYVGSPLPGVEAALLDLENRTQIYRSEDKLADDFQGELLIKSNSMFDRYLGRPEATNESFVSSGGDRWFLTGDCAQRCSSSGYYKILGRLSQDIIKKAGYKISALEIENRLLQHS